MATHIVTVHGLEYQVTVYRISKTVFRASGDYKGTYETAKGRTETAALSAWRERNRYMDN